ncbi:hypothetical protein KSP40_PGU016975 [Platanthera guangdongensis]|uniref:Acid phosphatase/vanadium-dependent haloperoxidase-related protein n=1 Tax=Platanthera guangdongensis TaxID=2320717 RepID=A0ABR2M5A2_9ASPA
MDEVLTAREIAASSSVAAGAPPPLPSTMNLPLLSALIAFSAAQILKLFTNWKSLNPLGAKDKKWQLGAQSIPTHGQGSHHKGEMWANLTLHFCKRLLLGLEPMTSRSHGNTLPGRHGFNSVASSGHPSATPLTLYGELISCRFKEKRWDSRRLLGSGGMPSSHSATVVALATAIGLHEGTGGSSFALATVLASIVMYDASGIRLHAGRQAEVLNQIVCELPSEHPLSSVRPLRELLGHTPLQVIAGAVLGCLVSYLLRYS